MPGFSVSPETSPANKEDDFSVSEETTLREDSSRKDEISLNESSVGILDLDAIQSKLLYKILFVCHLR